jgi:PAS domain S-box-containing protein
MIAALRAGLTSPRGIAWLGGTFIAIIIAMAAYDVWRDYEATVSSTARELDTQARTLAEQTARSIQAVDVQLRHFAQQYRQGTFSRLSDGDLNAYMKEQAVGLVQVRGLLVVGADGVIRASSYMTLEEASRINISNRFLFQKLRADESTGLLISHVEQSYFDHQWMFPMGRRLETPTGEFAGIVAARGRIHYFQDFYRDIRLDRGTKTTLMQLDGRLLARYPEAEAALGQRFPLFDEMLADYKAGVPGPTRTVSPIDGVERFGALRIVPDYPLAVIVTRDVKVALAPWRAHAIGTAIRTFLLSALAAALLAILLRQLSRLRASEERFALAVAGSNDGIVDWDIINDRMYSSERAMQIVGIDSRVTVRSRAQWRALVKYHADDVERMRKDLQDFLDGRSTLRQGEYRVLLPNGEYRWIRHRNKCVRDVQGKPIRVAGSVSDIDAQKRAEVERLRLEGQLLQAKKLEAIGTLAGGIAHDFNNILAAILGYGEMAQKAAQPGTTLKRHIDATVNAGMRAKSLVERILAFSRSGIGERVPVNVQSVVVEALDLAAASLPSHVRLERRLEAGDAAVMGDATQIHQVVMNLCTNAAQAMKTQGTLTVALDVVEKRRSMAATSELSAGKYVRLSVHDTGSGIPPTVLERIFDPFYTTKEVGVGTGLGLSLVHGIVTDLGGGIDVDSRVGGGTTFTVYLPWSDSAAVPAAVEDGVPVGSGETILIVDDEEPLVRLGEEMVAGLGYEPVGFTSSVAALAAVRDHPDRFHAVLSDEAMPDMTGSELAAQIRAIRPDIPIVLMTGFVSAALAARAHEIGNADVLAKPLVERDIARTIAGMLRSRPGHEPARASLDEARELL